MVTFFAEVGFGYVCHFAEDHGGDFFRGEVFGFVFVRDLDVGFVVFVDDFVGEALDVFLDLRVVVFSPD